MDTVSSLIIKKLAYLKQIPRDGFSKKASYNLSQSAIDVTLFYIKENPSLMSYYMFKITFCFKITNARICLIITQLFEMVRDSISLSKVIFRVCSHIGANGARGLV